MDEAEFYTGLVAELYGPLRSGAADPEPYARFVELSGTPALELGCGDGDPLLELRRRGLEVEGLDSSADMLDRCRRRAASESLDVVLHHDRMESFDLGPLRYRSIYLAGPTFTLLPDDTAAAQALARIRSHLAPGGSALVPLFVPDVVEPSELGRWREAVEDDGSTIRFSITSVARDETARTQVSQLRYERLGDRAETLERPWVLHWHSRESFGAMAASAGLTTVAVLGADGEEAGPDATAFAFWLRAADET